MSFEGQAIFYSDQNLIADNNFNQGRFGENQNDQVQKDQAFMKFMHFVLEVQVRNTYIYRYITDINNS